MANKKDQLDMTRKEELFVILQEECGEVVQAVSKILRFGEDSYHPNDKTKTANIDHLVSELGDIFGVLKLLLEENHIDGESLMEAAELKIKKLEKYMKN